MARIPHTTPDEDGRGFSYLWRPEATLDGVDEPQRPLKKGAFVQVYKAEVKFQWEEKPTPPDEEGAVCRGSWTRWFVKRSDAVNAAKDKMTEVDEEANKGKVLEAKVFGVDCKVVPQRDTLVRLLNKEGIDGKANLSWEMRQPEGHAITVGGSEED